MNMCRGSNDENLFVAYLSEIAPTTMDGVMIANIIWKIANKARGMLAAKSATGAAPTFLKSPYVAGLPMKPG